jgi:hypothetical protein
MEEDRLYVINGEKFLEILKSAIQLGFKRAFDFVLEGSEDESEDETLEKLINVKNMALQEIFLSSMKELVDFQIEEFNKRQSNGIDS